MESPAGVCGGREHSGTWAGGTEQREGEDAGWRSGTIHRRQTAGMDAVDAQTVGWGLTKNPDKQTLNGEEQGGSGSFQVFSKETRNNGGKGEQNKENSRFRVGTHQV